MNSFAQSVTGGLVLAATPIGNAGDASARLIELLGAADVIAAEDTRRLRDLARRLGVTIAGRVVSNYDHNERARVGELLDEVARGALVLVVSDAGMPTVSDPGYPLVVAASERGLPVTVVPGPSAVLTALAISGLATDRFAFEGFVPRKEGEQRRLFREIAGAPHTLVFFESPHRVAQTLEIMHQEWGPRAVAACRELTKTHEQVIRGRLGELDLGEQVRGEFVLVVEGASREEPQIADAATQVGELVARGVRHKDAVRQVAGALGVSRRELYEATLAPRA